MWEPGLPAIALVQQVMYWLTHRIREQARSHIWLAYSQTLITKVKALSEAAEVTEQVYRVIVVSLLICKT
jgi:hypothetical protein